MRKGRVVFECALLGILGVAVAGSTVAIARRGDDYKFFDPLVDVKAIISQRYVDEPSVEKLQLGAINGMLEALDDPYTVYVPPAETRDFSKALTGEYVGIGAQVQMVEGWLTIVSPLEESPAFRVGLMPEDKVVQIEEKPTFGLTVEACIDLLMGEPGTPVALVVERKGEKIPFTIVREKIKTRNVKGFHRDPADPSRWLATIDPRRKIAYIRLTQFTPGCSAEMLEMLTGVGASSGELSGLVLDLRFNGGGVLQEAMAIADMFLSEGVIVSTKGRSFPEDVTRAEAKGTLPDFPIAVLLNGVSASASEVLAGALVDNARAVAVGTRSFGKGLVQEVLDLPRAEGAQLKITEQRYYLPSGRCIQRDDDSTQWGVDPTPGFYVPMSDDEIVEMLKVRREEEILRAGGGPPGAHAVAEAGIDWADTDAIVAHLKDPQLAAALRAVQGFVDSGQWTATGREGIDSAKIAGEEIGRLREAQRAIARELIRLQRKQVALETLAPDQPEPDLWGDATDVSGGRVVVYDKAGHVVATLGVGSAPLERWLIDAGLKPEAPPPPQTPRP